MVRSDEASDESIAIRNDRHPFPKLGVRMADNHRFDNRISVDTSKKFVWDGPSFEIRFQDFLS